jgi:hypothetical protein
VRLNRLLVLQTAKDLASAFVAASARWESMQLCALANPKMIMVAALAPSPKVSIPWLAHLLKVFVQFT